MTLRERKAILRECFDNTDTVVHASGVDEHGELALQHATALDLEGVMAKRLDSAYNAGRTRDWLNSRINTIVALLPLILDDDDRSLTVTYNRLTRLARPCVRYWACTRHWQLDHVRHKRPIAPP
jgi:hypothetical protein